MRHQQDDEKCALPKGHYPFILSNLFADLVKRINVQSGGLATRARADLSGTMTGARGAIAGLEQVGAGNTRLATIEAASQEAWPEAESLAMKDSLGREPRWDADSRAPGAPGAAVPNARQKSLASVGVSPPNLSSSFVARVERSETREQDRSGTGHPGFCGACHRARHFGRDPLASSGLRICEADLSEGPRQAPPPVGLRAPPSRSRDRGVA